MVSFFRHLRKRIVFGLIALKSGLPSAYLEKYRELSSLKSLLDELEIDCVLDVGANVGQFAEDLRLIGYKGQIISFEPVASEFAKMKAAFGADKDWSGHQIALGRSSETKLINVAEDTKLTSLLEENGTIEVSRKEEISVKRLDEIFKTLRFKAAQPRILLKTDTQGYDLDVFCGAASCLSSVSSLMAEISVKPIYANMTGYRESLRIYEDAGFSLCNLSVVSRTSSGEVVEMNCLMKRTAGGHVQNITDEKETCPN